MTGGVIALIPARRGSEGAPSRDLDEVGGKPLLAWSIQQARASARIDRVIVTTDDEEIAAVATRWGAEVTLVQPAAPTEEPRPDIDAFVSALTQLSEGEGDEPELVVHLRPTGPVRLVQDIDTAIQLLASHPEADAVRSVSAAHETPYKMWTLNDNGTMGPLLTLPGVVDCQSQPDELLPSVFFQNGYVDVLRPRAVLAKHSMWGDTVLPLVVDRELIDLEASPVAEVVEAEPEIDLRLAERPPVDTS